MKDAWWAEHGATRAAVRSSWLFPDHAGLDAVLHLEFPADLATGWLRDHPGRRGLSYGYVLFTVTKP